jgi:hypothetical protein
MLSQSRLPFDVGSRVAVQTRHLRLIDGRVYPVPIGLAIVHHWQAGVFDNSVLIGPHIETSMLCDGTVSFQHNVALAVHVASFLPETRLSASVRRWLMLFIAESHDRAPNM